MNDLPANPYPMPSQRLEDREGYPFKQLVVAVQTRTVKREAPAALAKAGWLFEKRKGV